MLQSYISTFKKGFDFKGRATRKEYFIFFLTNVAVLFLIIVGALISVKLRTHSAEEFFLVVIGAILVAVVFSLIMIIPLIAVGVRRLHDRNMSGWWYLIQLVPSVGGLIFLVLTLLPSVNEGNRYGELQTDVVSNSPTNTPLAHDEEVIAVIEEDVSQVSAQTPTEVKA